MVPEVRIELTTYPLPRGCATTTLLRLPGFPEGRAYSLGVPSGKGRMKAQSEARKERLAAALRANLRRRKAVSKVEKGKRAPAQTGSADARAPGLEAAMSKE